MKIGRLNAADYICMAFAIASGLACAWVASTTRDRDTDPFSAELHVGSAR